MKKTKLLTLSILLLTATVFAGPKEEMDKTVKIIAEFLDIKEGEEITLESEVAPCFQSAFSYSQLSH